MTGGAVDGLWVLQSIGGDAFEARAELDLSIPGRVSGAGPCNGFSGRLEGDWPEMAVGPLRSTRRACPALGLEYVFFTALRDMRRGAVRDGLLLLTDDAGREMLFRPKTLP